MKKPTLAKAEADRAMKAEHSPSTSWVLAGLLLNTLAVLVAVAIVLFPSYSGLYGATKRADQGAAESIRAGWHGRWVPLEQADRVPRRISAPTPSVIPAMRSSQNG